MLLNDVSDEPADVNRIRKRLQKTMLTVEGTLYGKPALILIDSGSSTEFISADFVTRHHLSTTSMKRQQQVTLADGTKKRPTKRVLHTPVRMINRHYKINFTVLPLNRYDAILGMSWLRQYKPLIDWSALTFEPTAWPLANDVHTSDDSYTAEIGRAHV